MFNDEDDELKDWEMKEEVPSEKLKRKWAHEDWEGVPPIVCPSCKKEISADVLSCVFCGAQVLDRKSGFLTRFLFLFKSIFKFKR